MRRAAAKFGVVPDVEECHGRGIMVDGACLCDANWQGKACENLQPFNRTVSRVVGGGASSAA